MGTVWGHPTGKQVLHGVLGVGRVWHAALARGVCGASPKAPRAHVSALPSAPQPAAAPGAGRSPSSPPHCLPGANRARWDAGGVPTLPWGVI